MAWRAQVEEHWRTTEQFKRVDFYHIIPNTRRMLVRQDAWPADLRWVREDFDKYFRKLTADERTDRGSSLTQASLEHILQMSPRFFVAADQRVIKTTSGVDGWKWYIAPVLKELVGV
jgi:hypothetical protein